MRWYAAHLIMVVRFKDRSQSRYPLWENIILIEAGSEEDAWAKAEERGRGEEGDDDGSFSWEGKPARWEFAGVRKLTVCSSDENRPEDGTEISFLEMEAASRVALDKLLAGKPVSVRLLETFADEESETETPRKERA